MWSRRVEQTDDGCWLKKGRDIVVMGEVAKTSVHRIS